MRGWSVFDRRYEITGTLDLLTPLHIGTGDTRTYEHIRGKKGDNAPPQIACIARDCNNRPYLPSTTLKGVLLRQAELAGLDDEQRKDLFGKIKGEKSGQIGTVLLRGGRWRTAPDLSEAPYARHDIVDEGIYIAARTAINPRTGTADEHLLFFQEMAAAGTVFDVFFVVMGSDDEAIEKQRINAFLSLLGTLTTTKGVAHGKGQADGNGRLRLRTDSVKVKRRHVAADGLLQTSDCSGMWADRFQISTTSPALSWRIELECPGPFAVVDSSWVPPGGKSQADDETRGPQMRAQRVAKELPLLLGSSVGGALRAQARFLAAREQLRKTGDPGSIDDPVGKVVKKLKEVEALSSVERLFGMSGFRGLMQIDALDVLGAEPFDISSVRIDRFSGAPVDNALFTSAVFVETRIRLTISVSARGDATPKSEDVELAKTLVDDIKTNGLVLGHGGNKGFGWFTAKETGEPTRAA